MTRTGTGYTAAAPGHGRRGELHRHGHGRRSHRCSMACRSPSARARRPATSSSFIRRAMPSRDSRWRSPIRRASRPRRRSAPAPPAATRATAPSRPGEVLDSGDAQLLSHGEHRVHLGDYLLGQRRRGLSLRGRRQHRRQRLARADQRHAGHGRHVHGAQQCRRRGRQSQRLRACRRHEVRRARRRHGVGDGGRRAPHRQPRIADARRADEPRRGEHRATRTTSRRATRCPA